MDYYELENFITYGVTDFKYDSDDLSNSTIGLSSPTIDTGYVNFEVESQDDFSQTRGMNVTGHVILNFVGNLLTRQHHQLK